MNESNYDVREKQKRSEYTDKFPYLLEKQTLAKCKELKY